ncbi:MAG TPA: HAD family phosphatase [Polyangiaceae bacterium]|nr:HAD family phosphatase [Polyangiaceae bacterium]
MSSAGTPPRWGALFDWDGVLVDSKALHQAAWDQVAREFGYRHGPDDFRRHFGSQNRRAISEILRWTSDRAIIERISTRKEIIYRERLGATDIWMPGSIDFVERLVASSVPCAVVSSSPRENIDVVLARGGQRSLFRAIVTAEDTRASKPDPEGFRLGASRLQLPPERCVVFEDAPAGIQAGLAGGMRVVALSTTHDASELGAAHLLAPALGGELLAELERWFQN